MVDPAEPVIDEALLNYLAGRWQAHHNDTVSTWRAMTTLERRLCRLAAFHGWHVGLAYAAACRAAGVGEYGQVPIPRDRQIMEMVQAPCVARISRLLKPWRARRRDIRRADRLACEVGIMAFVRGTIWGREDETERDSGQVLFEVIGACRAYTSDRHYQVIQNLQRNNIQRRRRAAADRDRRRPAMEQNRFTAHIDVTNSAMCDVGVYRMQIVGVDQGNALGDDLIAEWDMTGDPAVFAAELPYPRGHHNHEEIMDAAEEALRGDGWTVTRDSAEDEWWTPTDTGYVADVDRT